MDNTPALNYVLESMFESTCRSIGKTLHYGSVETAPSETKIIIRASGFIEDPCRREPNSNINLSLQGTSVPVLFGDPKMSRDNQGRLILHADIVASAFYLLTRFEETVRSEMRDCHGRFPGHESLPHRQNFIHQPIVDQYRNLLISLLREEGVDIESPKPKFTLVLTHDIDDPFRYLYLGRTLGVSALQMVGKRQGNPIQSLKAYAGLVDDPFDTFDWMNEKFDEAKQKMGDRVRQIYFVMACENGPNDKGYTVEHKRVRKLLQRLKDSGAEFGLHPSYKAGSNPQEIVKEKKRLEDVLEMPITQSRHHYLRLREPEHTQYLIEAGFTDDYSAGYADVAGFRNGTAKPFNYFDLKKQTSTDFRIHPLPIMECTFESKSYMGLGLKDAIQHAQAIAHQSIQHKGELVLLWHNPTFAPTHACYHKPFYENVLDYIYQQDAQISQ